MYFAHRLGQCQEKLKTPNVGFLNIIELLKVFVDDMLS